MENVDRDYEILETGIKQLLGMEKYPEAERSPEPCTHTSDGYIYNLDVPTCNIISLLQCSKCGIQYEVLNATGQIL